MIPVDQIRVLMVTCAWPDPGQPRTTHFVKRQADFLSAAGVQVDVLHFQGRRRPSNYLRAWGRARRVLARARYDVVHAQFGQSGLIALPAPVPVVVTLRGSDILGIVGPGGRPVPISRVAVAATRFVCRRADAVIVVSEHMKAHLPDGVGATVIPSGLDFELFRPLPREESRRRLGLAADRQYVLFAGNPAEPRKRYDIAARATELAARERPVELLVAWGVPHTEMPYFMSACDAMVFTSMQEGSPNVVKEALACDLPVVSVEVGDVRTRLGGIDGCEVTPDDTPDSVAAGLVRVLRRGGRVAGRESVRSLDERACTQRVIDVYRSVMRRRSAGRAIASTAPATSSGDPAGVIRVSSATRL